jgi:hypothetical protein
MKKLIASIMLLLPFSAMASIPELSQFINRHANKEGLMVSSIDGNMIRMMTEQSDIDYEKISLVEMMMIQNTELTEDIMQRVNSIIADLDTESLIRHCDDDSIIEIRYTPGENDNITHIIVLINSNSDNSGIIVISCDISPEELNDYVQFQI